MKKYISLIVCSVLLIIALVMGAPAKASFAGRGPGADASVSTVEHFVDVLDFFQNYELTVPGVSAQSENSGYMAINSTSSNYSSATFYNKSRATISNSSSYEDMSSSSNTNYTREMTIYLTKNAALYHSVGVVLTNSSMSSDGESKDYSMIFDFDMHIYFNSDDCFVRFDKWDISASGEDVSSYDFVKPSMIGKWYIAGELGAMLLSINSANYELLGGIGDYFEEFKLSKFNQSGKVYTLKDEFVFEAFSLMFGTNYPEDVRGGFTLNLSNKVRPTMSIRQAYSDYNGESGYSQSITAYSEDNIAFVNINNTVIDTAKIKTNDSKLEDMIEEDLL